MSGAEIVDRALNDPDAEHGGALVLSWPDRDVIIRDVLQWDPPFLTVIEQIVTGVQEYSIVHHHKAVHDVTDVRSYRYTAAPAPRRTILDRLRALTRRRTEDAP